MENIHFGTSGWRDIIAEGFTFDRAAVLVRAIARRLKKTGQAKQGVLVGRDDRFLAENFAEQAAQIMAAEGVPVTRIEAATPTPVLALVIRQKQLAGGINFTASHNPPPYQGLKWSNAFGGPATREEIAPIEKDANQLLAAGTGAKAPSQPPAPIHSYDPKPAYFKALQHLVPMGVIRKAGLAIVADPLFGAGRGYLDEALRLAGCRLEVLHNHRDVLFGGHNPEPDAANLQAAAEIMKKTKSCLVLGTDGDADRFGVVDRNGVFITPNQVLALTVYLLVHHRRQQGRVVRSVVTSHLVDRIAELYSLPVEVTPVGFKYIGESMRRAGFLTGGEESGGLTIAGHVPEKDGILACLLMAELVAREGTSLTAILRKLFQRTGVVLTDRINVRLPSAQWGEELRGTLQGYHPQRLAGQRVVKLDTTDGFKYLLEDHSWLAVRLSGTEPVARLYLEARTQQQLKRLAAAGKTLLNPKHA